MALHRYGDFRVEVFYFDSPCIVHSRVLYALYFSRFSEWDAISPRFPKSGLQREENKLDRFVSGHLRERVVMEKVLLK